MIILYINAGNWATGGAFKDVSSSSILLISHLNLQGKLAEKDMFSTTCKIFLQGRLTFLHLNEGVEMNPTIGTLLVRKIPAIDPEYQFPTKVYVGDVVVMKDPRGSANYLVRRLAATEGYEMASKNVNDEPFVLEEDQCWVLADNDKLKPKEAFDSRTFGPVPMAHIVGRAIYCVRNAGDHGPVKNSQISATKDNAVLEVELDVDEMIKNHKG